MNEFELKKVLREKRKDIKSFDDLIEFLKYIKENCNCGYVEAPISLSQASLAVAWYFASDFGITGFQAGAAMWDFILDWEYRGNECGLKLIDYDNMLYPQYEYKFRKTIDESTWNRLQETAKKHLEERDEYVSHNVKAHWESIVAGKVPFGYTVTKD